jgi:hypothetical protein
MPQFYTRLCICVLAGLAAWPAAAQAPRRVGAAGVTVALPPGWHSTRPHQGNVTNPLTRLVVSSGSIHPDLAGRCQTQISSYAFPKTAVAIVLVEWTRDIGGMGIGRGPGRPRRFTAANLPVRAPIVECFAGRGGSIEFAARRHTFGAYVLLGTKAPSRLADAARAVLDTLRIAPR